MSAGRRIKVAVVIGTLEMGGAERDIVRNFPLLDREEFEVVVVLFQHPGALAPELERQGVRYVARCAMPDRAWRELGATGPDGATPSSEPFGDRVRRWVGERPSLRPLHSLLSKMVNLVRYVAVTRWLGRTLRAEHADIMHAFLPHSYVYGMFACAGWSRRTKTVMSRLSLNFYEHTHGWIARLERVLLHRRVGIAIGNSQLILDELIAEGVPRERVRLLHNGIDVAAFTRDAESRSRARAALGLAADAFVVVAVGNLHTYKGHGDLIDACARAGLPAGWQLFIVGRDQEGNRAAYEARAAALGVEDNIRLLGSRDDIPTLLLAADVFAQPSLHEGLPNAVIEAMAASLPVIGTSVGGIPEAVTAGGPAETGWLVPPGNVEALAAALAEAAADRPRLEAMGRRARARAESEFSLERSVREYEAIYRQLTT